VKLDVSAAPEIAQLIEPGPAASRSGYAPGAAGAAGAGRPGRGAAGGDGDDRRDPAVPTVGRLARQLRLITAAPEQWWGLVRFDPSRPVRVSIPVDRWYEAWLQIIPAPERGGWPGDGGECGCEVATVVAGEVAEQATEARGAARALLPGRVRVHGRGRPHRVMNLGGSYAVSMHARARVRAEDAAQHRA
jgi:hypothetical protein